MQGQQQLRLEVQAAVLNFVLWCVSAEAARDLWQRLGSDPAALVLNHPAGLLYLFLPGSAP